MISMLKLMRYKNLLMVLLTIVLTQYSIISPIASARSNMQLIVVTIAIICITAGGYIINDIFDVTTDIINKPARRIIGVSISKKKGLFIYFIFTTFGLLFGTYAAYMKENSAYVLFFVGPIVLLYLYSKFFKRIAIIGNLVVSFLTALPIYIVYIFTLKTTNASANLVDSFVTLFTSMSASIAICIYCLLAFFMTFIRELIKDIEDINGDYSLKMNTLPIIIGTTRTKNIIWLLSSFIFVSILALSKEELYNNMPILFWYTMLCIAAPFAWFLYKLYHSKKSKDFQFLSQLLKYILFSGILSMLLLKL